VPAVDVSKISGAAYIELDSNEGARHRGRSDCHPSEGASKHRTQISIIHSFCLFSSPPSLG
jgi:hypothetical protein